MGRTLIYRIEDPITRTGPYNNPDAQEWVEMAVAASEIPYMPTPWEEGYAFRYGVDRSGFESLDQMIAWFDHSLAALRSVGYVLAVYSVPDENVARMNHQVAFEIDAAELLEYRKIPT